MIRALLNIVGVTQSSLVLDPYVGSGALEASLLGWELSVFVSMYPHCACC